MLDLSTMMLNQLPTLAAQDNGVIEVMPELTDELQYDEDNLDDADSFLMLFADVVASTPVLSQDAKEISVPAEIDRTPITEALENNVALAWINSDYYQTEMEQSSQSDVLAPKDTKPVLYIKNSAPMLPQTQELRGVNEEHEFVSPSLPPSVDAAPEITEEIILPLVPQSAKDEPFVGFDNQLESAIPSEKSLHSLAAQMVLPKDRSTKQESFKFQLQEPTQTVEQPILEGTELTRIDLTPSAAVELSSDLKNTDLSNPLNIDSVSVEAMVSTPNATTVLPMFNQVNDRSFAVEASTNHELTIPVDIEHPEWSKQFSDQVTWLSQQGLSRAVIKLHPEDLGPLEINVRVLNNVTSLQITSQSNYVRDLIDQSLPRLQEMMSAQGLDLSEVNIDSQQNKRQFNQQQNDGNSQERFVFERDEEDAVLPKKTKSKSQGVVDYFA